jgi:hypothetical protein
VVCSIEPEVREKAVSTLRGEGPVLRWKRPTLGWNETARFVFAGYIFAVLSLLPLVLIDINRAWPQALWVPVLALLYSIPFVCAAICWMLWKRVTKPSVTTRQESLCLLAIWLLVTTGIVVYLIYLHPILYLPFEPGGTGAEEGAIRFGTPILGGFVLSPIVTMLGALTGNAAYYMSARWGKWFPVQLLFMLVILGLEVLSFAVVYELVGLAGVGIVLGAVALAVAGKSVKRYRDRQLTR